MPEREKFPKAYFSGNPYEGEEAEDAYTRLRWGNEPERVWEIEGPEDMATLGTVAKLVCAGETIDFEEGEAPYLALGLDTNRLYIVPADENGEPVDIPGGPYTEVTTIKQTDYYSDKGGEDAYYYHEHEDPYPRLFVHESGVAFLEPEEMEDGSRSYAVGDEGVIG